jgi:hypothetical protein
MDMELVLVLLAIGALFEVVIYAPFIWRSKIGVSFVGSITTCLIVFSSLTLIFYTPNIPTVLLVCVCAYKVINMLRIFEGRMNERYMRQVTLRTALSLTGMQVGILTSWWLTSGGYISGTTWLTILVGLQLSAGGILFFSTLRRLRHTKLTYKELNLTTNEAPTVTIAIPARNETEDLYDCITSLLRTEYPKLEILVLDDCSQLKRTPEIIRSFAHRGVRFIKGDTPKENWLAKNQAYDKLLHEASGEIMLFCGVDIRFRPDTIRQIVTTMITRDKRMISVLPLRHKANDIQYSLVQAARYFWELAPPRRLFNRPPILSSCWVIYRKDMLKLGGFAAVTRAILPEAYFAKQMLAGDGYSFMRADKNLPVYSAKSHERQRDTAIRVRYPQLHRRPETVITVAAIGVACFAMPFGLVMLGIFGHVSALHTTLAGVSVLFLSTAYTLVAVSTKVNSWYIAPFYFLPMVAADIVLTHYSMYKYEFSEVIWKGRNVCLPVMHVIPHLPKM